MIFSIELMRKLISTAESGAFIHITKALVRYTRADDKLYGKCLFLINCFPFYYYCFTIFILVVCS